MRWFLLVFLACGHPAAPSKPRAISGDRVDLKIETDEADAALAMIGAADKDGAWERVVETTGFQRLVAREQSMKRTVDLAEFRASIEARTNAAALRETLARWQTIDLDAIAKRVFAYLPASAKLRATIYPVIKPRENSFVYFDDRGAAIFMFLDPTTTTADVDNTIAHELHHIGYQSIDDAPCDKPAAVCTARTWIGAFGEGFAMLAAAGGPDVHPRGAAKPDLREHWDKHVPLFDDQLREVEAFLRDVLAGKLDEAAARERAMQFFGLQGPWYTVGWTMAVAIERCAGRAVLVETMRQPWMVLAAYNAAADKCGVKSARWDAELARALE